MPNESEPKNHREIRPREIKSKSKMPVAPLFPHAIEPEGWESSFPSSTVLREEGGWHANKKSHTISRRRKRRRIRLVYALAAGVAAVALSGFASWNLGFDAGVQNSLDAATKEKVTAPQEFLGEIDLALADLRAGKTEESLKMLQALEGSQTEVASLTYLLALAAMQNGNIPLAEQKASESIAKRERVSDSLALLAVLAKQKTADPSFENFGDPKIRSETLLRQSMLADAANPFPMVELATLLRGQKRVGEALALLRGARSRLIPVDSQSVVDATIELASLQDAPDSELPQIADPGKDVGSAFSAAYIAMRKGDFPKAADILKTVRKSLPADLFHYMVTDPAIGRYAGEPELQELLK